jgi:hypothetical protein
VAHDVAADLLNGGIVAEAAYQRATGLFGQLGVEELIYLVGHYCFRRSKAKQWDDAVDTLLTILDGYQEWRDNMPAGVSDSATAQRLDEVLALRDLVEQLQGVDLPQGWAGLTSLVNWKGYTRQHKRTTQRSGEFSTGTSGEISTGIDTRFTHNPSAAT